MKARISLEQSIKTILTLCSFHVDSQCSLTLTVSHFQLRLYFYFGEFCKLLLFHTLVFTSVIFMILAVLLIAFTLFSVFFMLSSLWHVFLSMSFAYHKCRSHFFYHITSVIFQRGNCRLSCKVDFWLVSKENICDNEFLLSFRHVSHSFPKFQELSHKFHHFSRKVYLLCCTWQEPSQSCCIEEGMLFIYSQCSLLCHQMI